MALFLSTVAWANTDIETRTTLRWLSAGSYHEVSEQSFNPENMALALPVVEVTSELRPELDVSYQRSLRLLVRPQLKYEISRIDSNGRITTQDRADANWSEFYAQWTLNDHVSIAGGLQNFQWGPAELANPSNRIFHETVQDRTLLYLPAGKHLARINVSAGEEWSFIGLAELFDNGKNNFVWGQSFDRKALLKLEYAKSGSPHYVGCVTGVREQGIYWVGEYGNIEILDGWTLYADASHQWGHSAFYPTDTSPVQLTQSKLDRSRIETLAILGMRYSFVRGDDLRLETLINTAGYTIDQRNRLSRALADHQLPQYALLSSNLAKFWAAGLDFYGKTYAYLSLRSPDLFSIQDLTSTVRYFVSLQDFGGGLYGSLEYALGSSGSLLLSGYVAHGESHRDAKTPLSHTFLAGYQHTW